MKNLLTGICFFLICQYSSVAQQNPINVDVIFKLHLFLDYQNTHYEALRNDSLLFVMLNDCEIVLENVEIEHNSFVSFPPNFEVYKMLEYSFKNDIGYYSAINIFESYSYMIAINNVSGRSYRLRGFNSNDFNHFFTDYKNAFNLRNSSITNKELKNLISINGLDINCLFRSIRHVDPDATKFPCLKNRNDPAIIR